MFVNCTIKFPGIVITPVYNIFQDTMANLGSGVGLDTEPEWQEAAKIKDIPGLQKHMNFKAKINAWKTAPLNIAGNSGTGKSTFINTIRGLKSTHKDAAKVGVTETTDVVKQYRHPDHTNFILSDLPGVGTEKFPREKYLEIVEFAKFDFFLILCSTRFTEEDLWLAKEVKKQHKNFFFIRTKVDQDLKNEKDDNPDSGRQFAVLQSLTYDCLKQLDQGGLGSDNSVFLISGKLVNVTRWDFPALQDMLIGG